MVDADVKVLGAVVGAVWTKPVPVSRGDMVAHDQHGFPVQEGMIASAVFQILAFAAAKISIGLNMAGLHGGFPPAQWPPHSTLPLL